MLYTIKLFAILAIVGGAIAWLGDVVGARLGKKRSSLFGLRPRQTARLVAVVIGAALPLGGLLVATFASEYAHKAVFEMEQLLSSVEDLKEQVTAYSEQARQSQQAASDAQEKATRSAESLAEKEVEVAGLTEIQGSLDEQVTGLEGEVAVGEHAVATAQEELRTAEGDLIHAQGELDTAAGDLTVTQEELRTAEEDVKVARLKRDFELARLLTLRREVEAIRERDRLITGRPAIFELGDELMRVTMDADGTQDQMESKLFELLFFAGAVAERRGVPTGDNGRAVIVVAPAPSPVEPEQAVTESAVVRYVASELRTGGPEQWVVIVRTFRRLFAEEETQLQVQIKATPNELVFEEGEVLAAIGIDAEAGTPEIFTTIYGTITDREKSPVRIMAMARRMLPDPDTGNYGQVHLNEIFDAAAEVQELQGIVPVRVVAQRDTYTVGPLAIDLQVGEGSP